MHLIGDVKESKTYCLLRLFIYFNKKKQEIYQGKDFTKEIKKNLQISIEICKLMPENSKSCKVVNSRWILKKCFAISMFLFKGFKAIQIDLLLYIHRPLIVIGHRVKYSEKNYKEI